MNKKELRASFANQQTLREGMQKGGLDVIIATSPEAVFYLSGCYISSYLFIRSRLHLVVVPVEGAETFIIADLTRPLAISTGWIEDIRTYAEFVTSPIEVLAKVLAEKSLSKGRIGIEASFCTVECYQELLQHLPEATFVPADAILSRARAIKTSAEVERLSRAALLTEEAVYRAWKNSRTGDTEKNVAERMTEEFTRLGAERVNHTMFACGQNTTIINHSPGSKKLEIGDIVHSDHGAIFQGFWSDLGRMGVVQKASQRQRDLYRTLWEVHQEIISRMKPGIAVRELFHFAKSEYTKRGIDFSWAKHVGHSMGQVAGHEEPIIHPFNQTPLEPNMLIAIEPCFMTSSEYYHIEDLVLVTDEASKILSSQWNTEELFVFE